MLAVTALAGAALGSTSLAQAGIVIPQKHPEVSGIPQKHPEGLGITQTHPEGFAKFGLIAV